MKRCVVVGGADLKNTEEIKKYLREDDYFIFCDSALRHLQGLGVKADLIVGDFDSHFNPAEKWDTIREGLRSEDDIDRAEYICRACRDSEIIVLPCEKDDTDTVYGVREGLKRGFDDFLLLGMTGQRFDHTFGNISILLWLYNEGKNAVLADDYSQMLIVGSDPVFIDDSYAFFSLLNISGKAEKVSIKGAKYCLDGAAISSEYQYGISNEVIEGQKAQVSVKDGKLLLVKVIKQDKW